MQDRDRGVWPLRRAQIRRRLSLSAVLVLLLGVSVVTPAAALNPQDPDRTEVGTGLVPFALVSQTRNPNGIFTTVYRSGDTTIQIGSVAKVELSGALVAGISRAGDGGGLSSVETQTEELPPEEGEVLVLAQEPSEGFSDFEYTDEAVIAVFMAGGLSRAEAEQALAELGGAEPPPADPGEAPLLSVGRGTSAPVRPISGLPAAQLGCNGKTPIYPISLSVNNTTTYAYTAFLGCRDYVSGATWYVAEKITTSFKGKDAPGIYEYAPEVIKSWVKHASGNQYVEWDPNQTVDGGTGCKSYTVGLANSKSGLSFSMTESICDGRQEPYGPFGGSEPAYGSKWTHTFSFPWGEQSRTEYTYGMKSLGCLYSPRSASYSSNLYLLFSWKMMRRFG